LARRYDVLTFDCYGTLIDWSAASPTPSRPPRAATGISLDRTAVLRAYHEIEPAIETDRYRPYREVLTLSAQRVARAAGLAARRRPRGVLPRACRRGRRFADTNAALQRLAGAGYRLASSPTWTTISSRHCASTGVSFASSSVTASRSGSYKPAPCPLHDRRGSASPARRGCTWRRAGSTTSSRRGRSASGRVINRRQQRRADGVGRTCSDADANSTTPWC